MFLSNLEQKHIVVKITINHAIPESFSWAKSVFSSLVETVGEISVEASPVSSYYVQLLVQGQGCFQCVHRQQNVKKMQTHSHIVNNLILVSILLYLSQLPEKSAFRQSVCLRLCRGTIVHNVALIYWVLVIFDMDIWLSPTRVFGTKKKSSSFT